MTTVVHLVRHAAHDDVGSYLAGRTPGVLLGEAGLAQAARVARKLRGEKIDFIQSSPIERAAQTAHAIASYHDAKVELIDALVEVDFGDWSGKTFGELNEQPHWRMWNVARGITTTPGGETMLGVQARVIGHILDMVQLRKGATLLMVSHADPIRAALAAILGLSLDRLISFDIDPASLSTIAFDDYGAVVRRVNEPAPADHTSAGGPT
ncbi:MAG: phosphoglycerate mutase protein [Hyphomicrobiales bacterium]|nr:phosphoglycerate mutase protein [Hyphomicrobiales bacterium]